MAENTQAPTDTAAPSIDTTPLTSTTSRERRDSLEKHLQHRPDEQELKDRHILLDTNAAPALQAKQAELERQRVSDSLRKGLEKRPEKEVSPAKWCCCSGFESGCDKLPCSV